MYDFQELLWQHNVILQEKHVWTPENMVIYGDHMVSTEIWAIEDKEGRRSSVSHISELL